MFTRARFVLGLTVFLLTAMAMITPAAAQTPPFQVMLQNPYPQGWVPTDGPISIKFMDATGTAPQSMDPTATSNAIQLYKLNPGEVPTPMSVDTARIVDHSKFTINWNATPPIDSVATIVMNTGELLEASTGPAMEAEVRYAIIVTDQASTDTSVMPPANWAWFGDFKTSFSDDRPHIVYGMAAAGMYPVPAERQEGIPTSALIEIVFSTPMDTASVAQNFECLSIDLTTMTSTPITGTPFWVNGDPAFLPDTKMTFQPTTQTFPDNSIIEWSIGNGAYRQGSFNKTIFENFDLRFATGTTSFPPYFVMVIPVHFIDNGQERWGFEFEVEGLTDLMDDLDMTACNVSEFSALNLFTAPVPLVREQPHSRYYNPTGMLYGSKLDYTVAPGISPPMPAVFDFNLKKISDGTFVTPAPNADAVGFNNQFPQNARVEMNGPLSFHWSQTENCVEQEIIVKNSAGERIWNMMVPPFTYDPLSIPQHYVHYMGQPLGTGDYSWTLVSTNAAQQPTSLINQFNIRPVITGLNPSPDSIDVRVESPISMCFSADMNRAVVQDNFTLFALDGAGNPDGNAQAGNWTWTDWDNMANDQWAYFYPAAFLSPGRTYRATIGSAIDSNGYAAAWMDYSGVTPEAVALPKTWTFTVSDSVITNNTAYPVWVAPTQGMLYDLNTQFFDVHFSNAIDFDFNGTDIYIYYYNQLGSQVFLPGTWDYSVPNTDRNAVRFTPTTVGLNPYTEYKLKIDGGYNYDAITPARLGALTGVPYEFIYRTSDGSVSPPPTPFPFLDPAPYANNVDPNGIHISIDFTESVDPVTFQNNFLLGLLDGSGTIIATVSGEFDWGTSNNTHVNFVPGSIAAPAPLASGATYRVEFDAGIKKADGITDYPGLPYQYTFSTSGGTTPGLSTPMVFSVNPNEFAPGGTYNVTITGTSLEFVHTLLFTSLGSPSARGADDFSITGQVPTGIGNGLTSINATITVSPTAALGRRDMAIVGFYNGSPFEAFLYDSINIGAGGPSTSPYDFFVHTVTYQPTVGNDPMPSDHIKPFGLVLVVDGDWMNLESIQSVNVKGKDLPIEGLMLEKHYSDGDLFWRKFIFVNTEPVVGETYEFTVMPMMNPTNPTPTPVVETATVNGLNGNYSTFVKPDAGVRIDDSYGLRFAIRNSLAPPPSNFFGFNEGNYVKFTQAGGATKEVVQPWGYSYFRVSLIPGETYKIEAGSIELGTDGQPLSGPAINYTINNFVMPTNNNVNNAGAVGVVYFPLLPDITNPVKYTMIPDVRAGIEQAVTVGAIINDTVDLAGNDGLLIYGFKQLVSTPGSQPPMIEDAIGTGNLSVNPYQEAINALVTNGVLEPQTPVTGTAADVHFFRLYIESFIPNLPPVTVWNFEALEGELVRNLDGDYVIPYMGPQLAPGNYRAWILTFNDSENGAAASTWFEVSGGADFAHVPRNGAIDVPGGDPIVLTFGYPVDRWSVEGNFMVMAEGMTLPAQGTFQWTPAVPNGMTPEVFTWTPAVPLAPGMTHEARLGTPEMPARTADFKPIVPKAFRFKVANMSGPYVTDTIPNNGQREVPTFTDVVIHFSVPMEPAKTQAAFKLSFHDQEVIGGVTQEVVRFVEGQASVIGNELRFLPAGELMPGMWYDVLVGASAESLGDLTGTMPAEPLGHEFHFSFMTFDPNALPVYPPILVSHLPSLGEPGVPLDAVIRIEFDQAINPESIIGTSAKPSKVIFNPALAGAWTTTDNIMFEFRPTTNMAAETFYNVYIAAGIPSQTIDSTGTPILSMDSFGFNFTTGGAGVVGDVPRVVFTFPMNDETEVFEWTPLTINFNKAMDHTVTENAITVTPDVVGSVRWMNATELPEGVGDTLVFEPTTAYSLNTRYNVKISTAAKDTTNKFLPAEYNFSFTTRAGMTATAPYVMGTMPFDGQIGVPTSAHISINFSKQMDKVKTLPVLSVYNLTKNRGVLGTWTYFGNGFDFAPALPFAESSNIKLTVGAGATDTDGQALGATYYMNFTTGAAGVAMPPFVMATDPGKTATGTDPTEVPTASLVTIVFDRPMDKVSVQSAITFSPAITIGTWTWNGTAVTIKPATALSTGTKYTVKVAKTAKSAEGAPMAALPENTATTEIESNYTHIFGFTTTTSTVTKPIVLATYPEKGRIGWPVNGRINISFSKEMNFALTEAAIASSPAFAKNFLWTDPYNLTIAPVADLSPGTLYNINVSTAAKDINNQALAAVYNFSFTTATSATATPQVVSVTPANGSYGVALDAKIRILFSKDMNTSSVERAVMITPAVSGYWNWLDGKTAIFNPIVDSTTTTTGMASGFMPGTFYEVMIGTDASDINYNGLPNPYFFTFETKYENVSMPPMVMNVTPAAGGWDVAVDFNITVSFDRPMNKLSTQGAFSLSTYTATGTKSPVAGVFRWLNSDTTLVFDPTTNLANGTFYTVEIQGTAKDTLGVAMGYMHVSDFNTIGDTVTDAPRVVNAMPPAGATGLPTDVHIFIDFDRPMNKTAVQSSFQFLPAPAPQFPSHTFNWFGDDTNGWFSVELSFSQALAENTEYYLALNPLTATDANGKPMVTPLIIKFKTGSATGTALGLLDVAHRIPGPDSINVPLTPMVEVGFTSPMNRALTEAAVSLKKKSDGSSVGITKFWRDDFLLLVKPSASLEANTAYTVSVSTAAESVDTTTLAAEVTWDFTTIASGTGLVIMNTVPNDKAAGFSASGNIEITFSKKMNRTSATLRISPYVEGSYKWLENALGGDTLTFDPLKDLTKGLPYAVTVPGTFAASDGSKLGTDKVFTFVVESGVSTGPRVVNTIPLGGSLGVPTNAKISIAFSDIMDQAATKNGFVLKKASDGSSVDTAAFTFGWDATGKLFNVTPSPALAGGTKYTVEIGAPAATATGSTLVPHTFSFVTFVDTATTAPTVAAAFPKNGQTNVPVWAPIHISFSKPMTAPADPFAAVLFNPAVTAADFSFMMEEGDRRFAFYPVKAMAAGTNYTVTVKAGVATDNTTAKNALASDHSFSFTTEQGAKAPTVVSTIPSNTAVDVPPFSNVVINFSEFMRFETMDGVTINPPLADGTYWFEWWGGSSLSLVHQGLADGTLYTVTLDKTKAASDFGVNMASNYTFTFTTGSAATFENKPYVTFTMPFPTETNVDPDMPVNISFSMPMDTTTVESAFLMKDAGGTTVEGVFTWFGDMSFIFEDNLEPATVYTVKISNAAKAADGSALLPFEYSFTTAGAAVEEAPVVLHTLPGDGAPEVPLMLNLVVNFSLPMDSESVDGAFAIDPAVPGTIDWHDETFVFMPAEPFQANTTYTATIGTGAKSAAGTAMAADYSFAFTTGSYTGAPKVLAVLPNPGFSNVPRATRISVTFSMPMDISTTQGAFSLKDSSGTVVPGSFGWLTPDTMTFKADKTLDGGKVYSVAITTAALGANAQALESDKKWTFTTGYSETIAPAVVYTKPFDSQGEVPLKAEIDITFSQAMDQIETPKAILILPPVQGTLKWVNDSQVKFIPSADLAKGSKYWVTIGTGAKSVTGTALPSAYTFSFDTFSGQATQGGSPVVESTIPAPGDEVLSGQTVEITFDREMNELLTLVVILPDVEVQSYWNYDETSGKSKLVIIPAEGWYAGSEVAIKIKGISADGSIMSTSYTLRFRVEEIDTAEPFVMEVTPRDGSDLVPVNVPIIVTFSEPMDTTATSTAMSLSFYDSASSYDYVEAPCTVAWSADGFAATVNPTNPLPFATTLTLFVDSSKAKDVNGVELLEDLYVNFTTTPDIANIVPGSLRWHTQLTGDLSEPARGLFGGTYTTNPAGVLFAVNPDGSLRWQKLPIVNGVTIENPVSVSAPCVNQLGEIVYTVDGVFFLYDSKGVQKVAFEAKTFFNNAAVTIVGPPAIDGDGAYVIPINQDDGASSKLYVMNPDGKLRWFRNMGVGTVNSPVVITREGNYLVHHSSSSTTHAILEYSRTGQIVVVPAVRTPGVLTSITLGDGNMVFGSINDKLMAFDRRKVVPQGASEAVKTAPAWELAIEAGADASDPIIGLKGLVYAGAGNTFAAVSQDGQTVVNYTDALDPVAGAIKAQGLVDADGKVFFAEGNKLRAVKLVEGVFQTVWVHDAGVEIRGMTKGRGGNLYLSCAAGELISLFGAPGVGLGSSTWPKFMGNIHNTGQAVNPLKGFIKNSFAEVTPFQAVTGTTVEFSVYANVTYRTSDMPEVNMISAATTFDPALFGNVEKFVDTIMVALPGGTVKLADGSTTEVAYSNVKLSGVYNLLGDILDATSEYDSVKKVLIISLEDKIYDSPEPFFRGVKIAFKAKAPATIPTLASGFVLYNKVTVFMGSSETGDFFRSEPGDGDAGGQIIRNSLEVNLVTPSSVAETAITEAYLEVQPKAITSNAGGKKADGTVNPLERYAVHIKIPKTARINSRGINTLGVGVPPGMVVSGVAVTLNGTPLVKDVGYKGFYKPGEPIYFLNLLKAVRQTDTVNAGAVIKVEFSVMTPDTYWMAPINGFLGYVSDFAAFTGGTSGTGSTGSYTALEPYACLPGEADGTAKNGDNNLLVIRSRNAVPAMQNLTPATDVANTGYFTIEWEGKDADSLLEYKLFFSEDNTLDLAAGFSADAYPINKYPVFDNNMLSAFDASKKQTFRWNIAKLNPDGTNAVPDGIYYIYVVANDGINPPVQAVSAGRVTVERGSVANAKPTLAIASVQATADASADIGVTIADADGDAISMELYFYPVVDKLRAFPCYGTNGEPIEVTSSASSATLTWDTTDVPDGSYYVMVWFTDQKHPGEQVWSSSRVAIAHTALSDNEPADLDWVSPDPTKPVERVQDKFVIAWKGVSDDDPKATVDFYYNKTQAEDDNIALIKAGVSLTGESKLTWETSNINSGVYFLLAKVKENKKDAQGAALATPTLRFWSEVPIFVDQAKKGGMGDVKWVNVTATGADIKFRSQMPTVGKVYYGVNGQVTSSVEETGKARNHKVSLTGLTPSTTYYFFIEAAGTSGNYTLNNNGEMYSFKTPAESTGTRTQHFVGGTTTAYATVILYFNKKGTEIFSEPLLTEADANGKWFIDIGLATDPDLKPMTLADGDLVSLEIVSTDNKTAYIDDKAISEIGSHTSSGTAADITIPTLTDNMDHKVTFAKGFNLVALPIQTSTALTAKGLLKKIGIAAVGIWQYDPLGGYKSVLRIDPASNDDSNFQLPSKGDFELDVINGFFLKVTGESAEAILTGKKLEKPEALSFQKGFNMITVAYGQGFPFDKSTGMTASEFLTQLGNDAVAVYSYEGGYKLVYRDDSTGEYIKTVDDFKLENGKSYFFKMKGSTAVVPPVK